MHRLSAGLTQSELAARAGVSRQLVAAAEAGHNAPGVDAALALARALGTTVEELFRTESAEAIPAFGRSLRDGVPLRVGRVGDRLVASELTHRGAAGDRWATPDAIVEGGVLRLFPGAAPSGLLLAGCDPALGVAEGLLRAPVGLLALSASTGAALRALGAGRIHAAVVHGPRDKLPAASVPVVRLHLARWQVGLGVAARLAQDPVEALLRTGLPVVQRDAAAASQQAFARAMAAIGMPLPDGPRADGHLNAASTAATLGCAAVTTEGAAAAFGLGFRPLEEHRVEIWLAEQWEHLPAAQAFANLVASAAFTERVARFGGYDLADCGTRLK